MEKFASKGSFVTSVCMAKEEAIEVLAKSRNAAERNVSGELEETQDQLLRTSQARMRKHFIRILPGIDVLWSYRPTI